MNWSFKKTSQSPSLVGEREGGGWLLGRREDGQGRGSGPGGGGQRRPRAADAQLIPATSRFLQTLILCCRAHPPPPLASCYEIQTNDRQGQLLTAARCSEVQGPPLPARRGPVAVGAGLHLHEGNGELVALPVVPVDPLRGRKISTSDHPGWGFRH